MRSFQLKFTLALLLTSLTAVLIAGAVARQMVLSKFNQNAMQSEFRRYQTGMQGYISAHGSYQQAQKIESFGQWMRRQNPNSGPPNGGPDGRNLEGRGPEGRGPRGGPPNGGPPSGGPPSGEGRSSFRFIVLDPEGRVLMGPPEMRGQLAPTRLRSAALPVEVRGQTAVLVVPGGEPNISPADRENLRALGQGLWRGIGVAMALAIGIGVFLGHRLGADLRGLTSAVEAMGRGDLRQRVRVKSRDEVGLLAGAFNRMSEDLALTHEKLQQSHAQISDQAQKLQELSVRDALTGLYNRRFYDAETGKLWEQSRRYNRPLTLMIGDIDFFKRINDAHCHAVGDEVLRHIAAILQKHTRQSDIVARYGGEEFVIAFPETALPDAYALCERLRVAIETYPWSQIAPELQVTMSMGLCDTLELGSAEKVVACADERLYLAKQNGRNQVCAPDLPTLQLLPLRAA